MSKPSQKKYDKKRKRQNRLKKAANIARNAGPPKWRLDVFWDGGWRFSVDLPDRAGESCKPGKRPTDEYETVFGVKRLDRWRNLVPIDPGCDPFAANKSIGVIRGADVANPA